MKINIPHNNKNLQRARHPGSRFLLRPLGLHSFGPIAHINLSCASAHYAHRYCRTTRHGRANSTAGTTTETPFFPFGYSQSYPILIFCLNKSPTSPPLDHRLLSPFLITHSTASGTHLQIFFTASRPVGVYSFYNCGKEGRSPFRGRVLSLLPRIFFLFLWIRTTS